MPQGPGGRGGNEVGVLWPAGRGRDDHTGMDRATQGTCPECEQGDLISISMDVGGSELAFTTCHLCEAKWWHHDGEPMPLQSVIGSLLSRKD